MTAEQVTAWSGLVVAIIALFGVVYVAGVKMARLEVKVETIWDFLLRRAMGEAVKQNLGTVNSPLTITEDAKQFFAAFANDLREFYKSCDPKQTDGQLMLEIERRFGERLVTEVVIPNQLDDRGACLLVALSIAKEQAGVSPVIDLAKPQDPSAKS